MHPLALRHDLVAHQRVEICDATQCSLQTEPELRVPLAWRELGPQGQTILRTVAHLSRGVDAGPTERVLASRDQEAEIAAVLVGCRDAETLLADAGHPAVRRTILEVGV